MKVVCRVKFRAFGITFGQFERVIPIDGEVWKFVKEHVVRPILQQIAIAPAQNIEFTRIPFTPKVDTILRGTPPPSDLPTGIKLKLIDERGVYLALE